MLWVEPGRSTCNANVAQCMRNCACVLLRLLALRVYKRNNASDGDMWYHVNKTECGGERGQNGSVSMGNSE